MCVSRKDCSEEEKKILRSGQRQGVEIDKRAGEEGGDLASN